MASSAEIAFPDTIAVPQWLFPLLESLVVGVALFDAEGALRHANSSYRKTLATQRDDGATQASRHAISMDGRPQGDTAFPFTRLVGNNCVLSDVAPTQAGPPVPPAAAAIEPPFGAFGDSAVVAADPRDGHLTFASPAARRMLSVDRRTADPCDSDGLSTSIHLDDLNSVSMHRVQAGSGRFRPFQYRLVDEQGRVARHIRETSFPIPSLDLAEKRIGGLLEDVSPEIMIYLVQPPGAGDPALMAGLAEHSSRITTFATQDDLLQVADALNPGCVILDIRHVQLAQPELLRILELRPADFQVILIGHEGTGATDIIAALKAGAADYIVEPGASESLPAAVHRSSHHLVAAPAPALAPAPAAQRPQESGDRQRLNALSRREFEVLTGLVNAGTNKSIARTLHISPRTVETHRAKLMQRLNCRTLTELLHFAHDAGLQMQRAG